MTAWGKSSDSKKVYYIGARGKLHISDNDDTISHCGRVQQAEAITATMEVPQVQTSPYGYRAGHFFSHELAGKFCKQCTTTYAFSPRLVTKDCPAVDRYVTRDTKESFSISMEDHKVTGENHEVIASIIKGKHVNKKIESPKITDELVIEDKQLKKATKIILEGIDTNEVIKLTRESVLEAVNEGIKSQQKIINDGIEKHNQLIVSELAKNVKSLEIKPFPEAPVITIDNPHKNFKDLVNLLSGGMNVLLVGPSGSFKTTSSMQAAEAMGLKFHAMSLGPTITESKVFGYMDANGKYVTTAFRKAYENGGCFLFDEFDAGHPSVLVTLNAALENGFCQFPDKMIERNEKFVAVASANTFGRGADRVYNGRNQIDGATMERFVVLNWDYDEDLEHVIAGDREWTFNVQSIRKACDELKIRHIVSPRASIVGARLVKAGFFDKKQIEEMLIWKGLDRDTTLKIRRKAKEIYRTMTGEPEETPEVNADSGDNPFA